MKSKCLYFCQTKLLWLCVIFTFSAIKIVSGQGISGIKYQIVRSEMIFENAPFPSCHASTIVETPAGLVAAFFGGTAEKNPDVGIWISRNIGSKWTELLEAANGIMPDGKRLPCWNPVLFRYPNGPLMLFYKIGPSPSEWWGMLIKSDDNGKTWSKPERLPDGFMGPVKNKPVLLKTGVLLCPSSTENNGWNIQMEMTSDFGKSWKKIAVLQGEKKFSAIQPSVLFHKSKLQILCRTKEGNIAESWSDDNGLTWSPLSASSLPNPNSGIDAVTLKNGEQLLVYNPTTITSSGRGGPRTPLAVAISPDGKNWKQVITLESEPGEYSYPAVIQASDGLVHIAYTWKRKLIKHVVIEVKD
jgi:predicted neuraminidase